MKISVVIVNFNTRDVLKECLINLSKIIEKEDLDIEVIIVDNASTDGSAEMVQSQFTGVSLLKSPKNIGLSAGSNLGYANSRGDYILFLGSDAFPKENTLKGMAEYFEKNGKVGIATCKLLLRDGSLDMDAHRGFPIPWAAITHFTKLNKIFPKSRFFNKYYLGYKNFKEPHEIDLCISHFMMIRRKVFEEIGTWDEDFFVFGEDVDFCYRAKEAGWKIMYLPQWEAEHYKGAGVGRKESVDIKTASNQDPKTVKRMKKETTKAMLLFYKKHYKNKHNPLLTFSILLSIKLLGWLRAK